MKSRNEPSFPTTVHRQLARTLVWATLFLVAYTLILVFIIFDRGLPI